MLYSFRFVGNTDPVDLPGYKHRRKKYEVSIRVADVVNDLSDWLDVNPRRPQQTSIVRDIYDTIINNPHKMQTNNSGITMSAKSVRFDGNTVKIEFTNKDIHGIINGGHTLMACLMAVNSARNANIDIDNAYVRCAVLVNFDDDEIVEIAESLNTQRQVTKCSIMNQRGYFDDIKAVMEGHLGAEQIKYHEGDDGIVAVDHIVQIINLFNCNRYNQHVHPANYGRNTKSLQDFKHDQDMIPSPTKLVTTLLPDILVLCDNMWYNYRKSWNKRKAGESIKFHSFGRLKISKRKSICDGSTDLCFIGRTINYNTAFGYIYPLLASFRANIDWDLSRNICNWIVDPEKLRSEIMDELVGCFQRTYESYPERARAGVLSATLMSNHSIMSTHYAITANAVEKMLRSS